ncbi:hypothetical protein FA13DRAFT_1798712 [Coprinellus micaceus]|uniref:MYND-type domain-containing protein n=1 Tax=Coprinellus micaceus TaxID=71717 RepID=A0A4Y7SL53_COPMI|nr:hypothetical protein FA13DRAFT_1798712 [Coprinellus micaceus]
MSSLIVVHKVCRAVQNSPHASQFATLIECHWSSILSWFWLIVNYFPSRIPATLSDVYICSVGQLLVSFSPLFVSKCLHSISGIELAFRLWDSAHNDGRLADVSQNGAPGVAPFLTYCFKAEDPAQAGDVLHRASHPTMFVRSLNRRLVVLQKRTSSEVIELETAKILLDSYADLIAASTNRYDWLWTVMLEKRTLVRFSECLLELTSIGSRRERRAPNDTTAWALMRLHVMIERVKSTGTFFLPRLEHLVQGGAIQIVHCCLMKYRNDTFQSDLALSLLSYFAPYVPYSPLGRATLKSLGHSARYRHLRPMPGWDSFRDIVLRASAATSKVEVVFASACDNIKHPRNPIEGSHSHGGWKVQTCSACRSVFYCSKSCQKEDWDSLHRAECGDMKIEAQARHNLGQWSPFGSRGSLVAFLLETYSRSAVSLQREDVRAYPDKGPEDLITTLDFRCNDEPVVSRSPKAESTLGLQSRCPASLLPRLHATLANSESPPMRVVQAIYPHNQESIYIVARLLGSPETGFRFLNGLGMIN